MKLFHEIIQGLRTIPSIGTIGLAYSRPESGGQPCPPGFVPTHFFPAKTFPFVSVTKTLLRTGVGEERQDETGQDVNK